MILTRRRAETRAKVLAACRHLIAEGTYPTGRALKVLCPAHKQTLLIRLRDEFVEQQEIDPTILWPCWTRVYQVSLGPDPRVWPDWTAEVRFALGPPPGWRPKPLRQKRRDARRAESEVRP